MKFHFALTALLCLTSNSWGAIEVTSKVELHDGSTAISTVVVNEGKWTSIMQEKVLLKLKADTQGDEAAQIKTKLYEKNAAGMKFLGKAEIITKWDEPAQVSVLEDDGTLRYRLTVTPSPVE